VCDLETSRIGAPYIYDISRPRVKAYPGEQAGKAIRDRLRRPYYLSRVDIRTDIRKYSFVNKTIKNWNELPAEALGTFPCKPIIFRKRVRKAFINGVK